MSRKTFRERVLRMEEAAWVINNEVKEIKQLYLELEEENVRLTEENRVLRLKLARPTRTYHSNAAAHAN